MKIMTPWERHLAFGKGPNKRLVTASFSKMELKILKEANFTEQEFKEFYFGRFDTNEFLGLHKRHENES